MVITWLLVAMSTASLAVAVVVRLGWRNQGPMGHWSALAIGAFNLGSAAALLTLAAECGRLRMYQENLRRALRIGIGSC
jgi:hypothetical protein